MAPKRGPGKAAAAAQPAANDGGDDYDSWPVAKLKARLQELGVTATGGKGALVERLKACAPAKAAGGRAGPKAEPKAAEVKAPPPKRGKAPPESTQEAADEEKAPPPKRGKAPPEPAKKAADKGKAPPPKRGKAPPEPAKKVDEEQAAPAKRGKAKAPPEPAPKAKRGSKPEAEEEPPTKRSRGSDAATAKAKAAQAASSKTADSAEPSATLEPATQVYYEDGEFKAEYAKSSKSQCKRCMELIAQGTLRLAKMVPSDKFDGNIPIWHHARCFLDSGLLPRSTALIAGFSTLRPEDQETVLQKVPQEGAAGGGTGVESALKKQNVKVFDVRDAVAQLSEAQQKEMLALNDYPTKKLNVSSTILDLIADGIVFGACTRCNVCKNEEDEREGGHVLLSGEGYKCTGWVSDFLKCSFQTQTPERIPWQLTPEAKEVGKLGRMKLKTGERLFASKLQDGGTSTASGSDPPKPPLLGLVVFIQETESMTTAELAKLVRDKGGQTIDSVTKAVSCVVSTAEAAEGEGAEVQAAKECSVPGVTEKFIVDSAAAEGGWEDMTPYLLWGEARRKRALQETTTRFVEKDGVAIDADVGEKLLKKAHVLVEKPCVYSEMLSTTDLVAGTNSFYTLHLLESDGDNDESPSYWVFRKWGRIGVSCGGKILDEYGSNKSKAIQAFSKMYLDKTGNTFGHAQEEFVKKPGKFVRVDIAHKALQGKKALEKGGAEEDKSGDGGPSEAGQPLGQLSKAQIEKADKVLDRITTVLSSSAGSAAGPADAAKIMAASAEYYSLVPHNFGLKKPPPINNDELLGAEKALLQFYLRMGFEEMGGEEQKLTPISGVMDLDLPKTLAEAAAGICAPGEVKTCVGKGTTMLKKKAGKPVKPMTADLYGAILLYTGNAIYQELNKALRDEDRAKVKKFLPYLRMLLEACSRLPTEKCTLWRGISVDLLSSYKVGSTITWWGVSSCTANQKVAQDFANSCGANSTFLTVETVSACPISQVSFYQNESESILLPGTQLEVVSAERKGKQAHIKLRELGRVVG